MFENRGYVFQCSMTYYEQHFVSTKLVNSTYTIYIQSINNER